MFERIKQWRAQRLGRRELAHMDPHLLRDIGLNPEQFRDPMADRASRLVLTPRRPSDF
jgi:uncharacterized protein YjiS (DUF1127 family)